MPEASALAAYCGAAFVLLITPGPAVTFIVARSVEQGRKAGLVSALGINAGIFIHVLAAVAGLSAIVASSAVAFAAVRYAGAAYLLVLGLRKLLSRREDHETVSGKGAPVALRRLFVEALIVNVLNPKTALFFLAFLPQFVPAGGRHPEALLFLGFIFGLMALCTDGTYALVAGGAGNWLRRRSARKVQHYLTATTYIGLGLTAAFAESHRKV